MKILPLLALAGLIPAANASIAEPRKRSQRAVVVDSPPEHRQGPIRYPTPQPLDDDRGDDVAATCGDAAEDGDDGGSQSASMQVCNSSYEGEESSSDRNAEAAHPQASKPTIQADEPTAATSSILWGYDVKGMIWGGLETMKSVWVAEKPEPSCEDECLQMYFAGEIRGLKGCTPKCRARRAARSG